MGGLSRTDTALTLTASTREARVVLLAALLRLALKGVPHRAADLVVWRPADTVPESDVEPVRLAEDDLPAWDSLGTQPGTLWQC